MSIRGRVGRHTREGGRHCQNNTDDQRTVTDLLNRIAVTDGGAAGSLTAPIRAGICGDALYAAISKFEDKYFPGQHGGYVEPGGPMLKRMETAAAAATQPAAETKLDILRRNVLNIGSVASAKFHGENRWTAGDLVQLDSLVKLAVQHIDGLKTVKDNAGKPLETLPWWGEVFGRVYIDSGGRAQTYRNDENGDVVVVSSSGHWEKVDYFMQYGQGIFRHVTLVAGKLPVLLLFSEGVCYPLRSKASVRTSEAHDTALDGFSDL